MCLDYSVHIVNRIAPSPRPPSPPGKGGRGDGDRSLYGIKDNLDLS